MLRIETDGLWAVSLFLLWAYRRAAWAIGDTPQDLGLMYWTVGRKGLESIESMGPKVAGVVERLLKGLMSG